MKLSAEDALQIRIFESFMLRRRPFVIGFHVPNGGYRAKQEAEKFKLMGVVPGVPDLVFFNAAGLIHFIELKTRRKGSKTSEDQDRMHQQILQTQAKIAVCRSEEDAMTKLQEWGLIE